MKNIWTGIAGCLAAAGSGAAFTPENGFGVGFVLGSPSGFSGSLPLGETNAINAIVGYDLSRDANLHLQADYVWHRPLTGTSGEAALESGKLTYYFGPGAFARLSGDAAVGVHGVAGIDYRFDGPPVQLFLEVGPGINILPDTRVIATGGLGLRYYF